MYINFCIENHNSNNTIRWIQERTNVVIVAFSPFLLKIILNKLSYFIIYDEKEFPCEKNMNNFLRLRFPILDQNYDFPIITSGRGSIMKFIACILCFGSRH